MNIISRKEAKEINSIYYFTGKNCKNNHISIRLTSTGQCRHCLKDRDNKLKNNKELRDKKNLTNNAWRRNNPERIKHYAAIFYSKPENRLKRSVDNKKYHKIYSANENFLIRKRKNSLEWIIKNREKSNVFTRNRRSRISKSQGSHTHLDIIEILKKQKYKCAEQTCKKDIRKNKYHVDHIMPLHLGGANYPFNLQCLCVNCNLRKSYKHPIEWANENGRLI